MDNSVFLINGVDYTDCVQYEGHTMTEEDFHAEGSGRNKLDALMEFTLIGEKRYLDITFRAELPPERVAELMRAVKANNRVNTYTAYSAISNSMVTFTGYINKRAIG